MSTKHKNHEKTYLVVLASLLVLTVFTVVVSYWNFGVFNVLVAMLVATVKGSLVCLFFMHLKYDNKVNQVVFASSFVFLAAFIGLTASDVLYRPAVSSPLFKMAELGGAPKTQAHEDLTQSTPELVKMGKQLYQSHCLSCHSLNTPFRGTSFEIYEAITNGVSTMPSYSDLGEKERWAITHFTSSLKK